MRLKANSFRNERRVLGIKLEILMIVSRLSLKNSRQTIHMCHLNHPVMLSLCRDLAESVPSEDSG